MNTSQLGGFSEDRLMNNEIGLAGGWAYVTLYQKKDVRKGYHFGMGLRCIKFPFCFAVLCLFASGYSFS